MSNQARRLNHGLDMNRPMRILVGSTAMTDIETQLDAFRPGVGFTNRDTMGNGSSHILRCDGVVLSSEYYVIRFRDERAVWWVGLANFGLSVSLSGFERGLSS